MAEPIHKINFAVKHPEEEGAVPSVTPTAAQPAGYYGDDNFALVSFTMDSVVNGHRYRIEIVDGSGAYDISELLDAKNKVISYTIPRKWTAAGTATLQLVEIEVGDDGTEKAVAHYPPVRLLFEARDEGTPMGDVLPAWQEVMTRAETVTNTVYEAYASGALHGRSGVYVGTGEMPADCNVQIDPTGDAQLAHRVDGRKFLFIGDSYTEGSQLAEGENTWVEHVAYWFKLTQGVDYFKYAKGGASFGVDANSEYNFTSVLKRAVSGSAALSELQRITITDIIVEVGGNDHTYGKTAIAEGVGTFMWFVRQNFPNAKVWLLYAGWGLGHEYRQALRYTYYYYDQIAPQFGIVCFNTLYRVLHNKNRISSDGVHPNAVGQQVLAYSIANALLGSTDVLDSVMYHNVQFGDTIIGRAYHNCDNIVVHIAPTSIVLDNVTHIVGSGFTKLFDVQCDILFGGADNNIVSQFTNVVILSAANGNTENVKTATLLCQLVKNPDGTLGLYARTAEIADGKFITHPNVTSISFYNNSIIIPIWDA